MSTSRGWKSRGKREKEEMIPEVFILVIARGSCLPAWYDCEAQRFMAYCNCSRHPGITYTGLMPCLVYLLTSWTIFHDMTPHRPLTSHFDLMRTRTCRPGTKKEICLFFNRKGKCKTTLTSLANFNCMSSWENSVLRRDFELFHAYDGGSWDESLGTSP